MKTEEFTKDLSSQILKMFMQEQRKYNNDDKSSEDLESTRSRESLYENKQEHEDSPTDSAYDSDKKNGPEKPLQLQPFFGQMQMMSKSSSSFDQDFGSDNVSVASTIKNAKFRDESISYDTIFRKLSCLC